MVCRIRVREGREGRKNEKREWCGRYYVLLYIVGWMQERTISAPGSRTTYLKWDFYFSDFVVAALRDFKIRVL